MEIKVTLNNGKQVNAFPPKELHSADTSKEICFFFDTGQTYFGFLRDIDEYDKYCDHIIVVDQTNNEVVGTYRSFAHRSLLSIDRLNVPICRIGVHSGCVRHC